MEQSIVDTYSAILKAQSGKSRSWIRHKVIDALCLKDHIMGADAIVNTPRIQFLYFHHIFKDEAENFERIVKHLAKGHTFISHSDAVQKLLQGTVDKAYISWSSDDGIENNMLAAEILNRYGAKCCFFLNPYSIGLTEEQRLKEFCANRLALPPVAFLSWNDVAQLQEQGHEIGAHTFAHSRVSELTAEQFEADFIKTDTALREKCGPIKHFAYTYGAFSDFNRKAFETVFKHGYDSCSSAVRGCHIPTGVPIPKEQLLIRRDQVIGAWPVRHVNYFIRSSASKSNINTNFLPLSYL